MFSSVGVSVFVQVLLIGNVLSQSSPAPQNPQDVIQAATNTMRKLKSDFENIKLRRERDFRNQLISEINSNENELYRSLNEEIFKPEENNAVALIEILKDTPKQSCLSRQRDYINSIKDKESKSEYRYCIADVDSNSKQVQQTLNEAQENVNTLATQAEQKINQCQRVYNLRGNMTLLQECLTEALVRMRTLSEDLDTNLQNLTNSQFASKVAGCVDRTVLTVKRALNTNYDIISKCLASFNTTFGIRLSTLIPAYKFNLTSNAKEEVTKALAALKAKPAVTLQNITSTRIKVEETLSRRSRNNDAIRANLSRSEKVVAYEVALFKATQELSKYTNSRSCLENAQNRLKDTINSNANDLKRCADGVRQTISVGDVNNLENDVLDRQKKEAQVAVVACLTSSGTVVTSNIVVCSAQADAAFQTFLNSVQLKLNEINTKADVIGEQLNSCERLAAPSLLTTLVANKFLLQDCVLNRLSINYTMPYD